MSVSLTVANASRTFPVGTTVKAYAQKGFPTQDPTAGAPSGTELGSAEVASDGSLTITGAAEKSFYVLAAEVSGAWRYIHVYAEASGEVTVIATQASGDFAITTAGKGLKIKEGSNAKMGSATLVAGTVTVANTSVTSESRIFLQRKGAVTHAGALNVTAKTAATSFKVDSSNAEDAGELDYLIVEPA